MIPTTSSKMWIIRGIRNATGRYCRYCDFSIALYCTTPVWSQKHKKKKKKRKETKREWKFSIFDKKKVNHRTCRKNRVARVRYFVELLLRKLYSYLFSWNTLRNVRASQRNFTRPANFLYPWGIPAYPPVNLTQLFLVITEF